MAEVSLSNCVMTNHPSKEGRPHKGGSDKKVERERVFLSLDRCLLFSLGPIVVLENFNSNYSTFLARPAGRHNNGRSFNFKVANEGHLLVAANGGAHPWPWLAPIHHQYTPLMRCCGRRAIPIALWPTVSIKLAVGMNHHTSPACRGLRVSELLLR